MVNLMNYYEHPGDNRYYVFEIRSVEKSITFESYLDEFGINFEKMVEEDGDKTLYGVLKSDFSKTLKANNLTEAQYRKPMIEIPALRYALVIIMFLLVGLAFVGYYISN